MSEKQRFAESPRVFELVGTVAKLTDMAVMAERLQ